MANQMDRNTPPFVEMDTLNTYLENIPANDGCHFLVSSKVEKLKKNYNLLLVHLLRRD